MWFLTAMEFNKHRGKLLRILFILLECNGQYMRFYLSVSKLHFYIFKLIDFDYRLLGTNILMLLY